MFKKTSRYSFKKGLPGKSLVSPSFVLRYEENSQQEAKFAVVVSKKVDKRATVRNKIKRKFLNILKESSADQKESLVFFLKKVSLDKTDEELKKEIKEVLNKI